MVPLSVFPPFDLNGVTPVTDPTPTRDKPNPSALGEFLARLKDPGSTPAVPRPEDESWPQMIARTTVPGRLCAVDLETYDYFLDVLPPRWMGRGFAFAEGGDDIRLYWKAGGQCFCRQLSAEETDEFYRLIGSTRYV